MQSQKTVTQSLATKPDSLLSKRYSKGRFRASLFALLLLGAGVLLLYNRQAVVDQITVWRFVPSSAVVALADTAGLNDRGKYYLYASQADVSDRAAFNQACGGLQNERTVVIGCYAGADKRIYIYNVTESQLDGIKETTAAHEMLHAAYDRLSESEKQRVDDLLVAQQSSTTDVRIQKLIAEYQQSEPDEVVNELHSIFGTEVRNLSPELETYYARYFSDRLKVVALKEKYETVFADLAAKQQRYVDELNALASTVSSRQQAYQEELARVNTDIAAFNAWAEGGIATRVEYDTRRTALQARISALDAERDAINRAIDTYDATKAKLDTLNLQAASLNKGIDSKLSADEAPSL